MTNRTFLADETGAVTVDWVVLSAGLVGLGLATMAVVSTGVQDTSGDIGAQLEQTVVYTTFQQRSHSAFYEAFLAEAAVSASVADGAASFASKMAAFEGFDDAALLAKIASNEAKAVQWQAQDDAYGALSAESVTVAEAAAAGGYSEASVQGIVDSDYGGDAGAYLLARKAHTARRLLEVQTVKDIADERGLSY